MDIDIDLQTTFDPLKVFDGAIRASVYRDGKLTPHPCGVYFQQVPTDPVTKLAAVPYEVAEELGCFKVDFLHLKVYDHVRSRAELKRLLATPPDWPLLQIPSVVVQLFQLAKHGELLERVKPRSIEEVADVMALIRPQKRYLLDYYLRNPAQARGLLYQLDEGSGYAFKKAHALAYALVTVVQLHLIKSGVKFD